MSTMTQREGLKDAIAKAIADCVGHGMREKCERHADAVMEVIADHLRERESAKAGVTDEIVKEAVDVYENVYNGNDLDIREKMRAPDTECMRAALEAVAPHLASARVPDGWMLVPKKFGIPADAWHAAQFAFGGPGTGDDEPFMDCTAWIGELTGDEGEKIHGLHIWCDECPEEGSMTLAEFPAAPKPEKE